MSYVLQFYITPLSVSQPHTAYGISVHMPLVPTHYTTPMIPEFGHVLSLSLTPGKPTSPWKAVIDLKPELQFVQLVQLRETNQVSNLQVESSIEAREKLAKDVIKWAFSIDPKVTANLQLVWVGVQPIKQPSIKQTTNFDCKQWKLTFDVSVCCGQVQTQPEICGPIEYAQGHFRFVSRTSELKALLKQLGKCGISGSSLIV